ncbi:hypothetical protein R1flu_018109 [Riccia fluitans]|uniref:Transposase n=1 Tax=Riccia fluitans TaxID=41844 RepID=A0ABD1ZEV8_9MARC
MLTVDVQNAANHWAGNHDTCWTLPGVRKCVVENWPQGRDYKYPEGGETHKAVKDFLKKYLTENKMKFYLRTRENFIFEMFHLVINKYATKCIHFDASHTTRLACATLDWRTSAGKSELYTTGCLTTLQSDGMQEPTEISWQGRKFGKRS